jgi:hypothetical protein
MLYGPILIEKKVNVNCDFSEIDGEISRRIFAPDRDRTDNLRSSPPSSFGLRRVKKPQFIIQMPPAGIEPTTYGLALLRPSDFGG